MHVKNGHDVDVKVGVALAVGVVGVVGVFGAVGVAGVCDVVDVLYVVDDVTVAKTSMHACMHTYTYLALSVINKPRIKVCTSEKWSFTKADAQWIVAQWLLSSLTQLVLS